MNIRMFFPAYFKKNVTIQSPAGDSVGNFVAPIGGMKGLLARKGPTASQ
jgi:hypothetical protein